MLKSSVLVTYYKPGLTVGTAVIKVSPPNTMERIIDVRGEGQYLVTKDKASRVTKIRSKAMVSSEKTFGVV